MVSSITGSGRYTGTFIYCFTKLLFLKDVYLRGFGIFSLGFYLFPLVLLTTRRTGPTRPTESLHLVTTSISV